MPGRQAGGFFAGALCNLPEPFLNRHRSAPFRSGHGNHPTGVGAGLERELVLAALLRRLNTVSGLDDADIAAIRALPITVRYWEAGRTIVSDGGRPTECCLVIEGF